MQAKERGRVQKDVMDLQQRNPFTPNSMFEKDTRISSCVHVLNVKRATFALCRLRARTYNRARQNCNDPKSE